MVSKITKNSNGAENKAIEAMEAIAHAATVEEEASISGGDKMITVRIPEQDKNNLKAIFAKSGVTLSGGTTMALYYLTELLEAGLVRVTKAGVIDIRELKRSSREPA
jgi:hypothetical protein